MYDRGAKHQSDDSVIDFYGGRLGIAYKDIFAVYGGAGTGSVEETYTINGSKVRWESDYNFIWLTGCMVKVYETDLTQLDARLVFDTDIQYRNTDSDTDQVTIGTTQFDASDPTIQYHSMEYMPKCF